MTEDMLLGAVLGLSGFAFLLLCIYLFAPSDRGPY